MKLAIVGCRDYVNQLEFYNALQKFLKKKEFPDFIISGGARGTDEMARIWAREMVINYTEYPAKWEEYGKVAGCLRNEEIVEACDHLIAFWDHKSKGTEHSIKIAKEDKKLVGIYNIVKQEWEYETNSL